MGYAGIKDRMITVKRRKMRRSVLGESVRVSMSTRLATPTMAPIAMYRCWDRDALRRRPPDHLWLRVKVGKGGQERILTKLCYRMNREYVKRFS